MSSIPTSDPLHASSCLSRSTKLAYGIGALPENILNSVLNQFGNSVYTIILALNPALVGIALAIPRLWDAISDLVVGNISDNSRTRWGRRKPFMLAGLLLSGVVLSLMFLVPPECSDTVKFTYFLIGCLIFYTCSTLYCVPFIAMGYELTTDYDERSRLMGWRAFFAPAGTFILPWLLAISQNSIFPDPITGVKLVSVGVAILIISIGLLPVLLIPPQRLISCENKPRIKFFRAIKLTLTNGTFLFALIPCVLVAMSINFTGQLFVIINIYHVYNADLAKGAAMAAAFITGGQAAGMISAPLIAKLAVRFGKKEILLILLFVMMCASLASIWLINPGHPWLIAIFQGLLCPSSAGVFLIYHAMIADVCDLDELKTGERREATYAAVAGWIYKTGSSAAIFISGMALWLADFKAGRPDGQSESTLVMLRLVYALVPVIAIGAGMFIFRRYPLTKVESQRIRSQLDARQIARIQS
jgi:GPH family glycoside/pentoside/hexuronide:cation symporter